jgi:hypothetical protein
METAATALSQPYQGLPLHMLAVAAAEEMLAQQALEARVVVVLVVAEPELQTLAEEVAGPQMAVQAEPVAQELSLLSSTNR